MEELRALFAASNTLQDRIRAFRHERLRLIAGNLTPANISGEGRLVLHIVPFSAFGTQSPVDIESLTRGGHRFHPLGSSRFDPIWNFDGYLAPTSHAYGQIFRNGIIEGVRSSILASSGSSVPSLHAINIEDYVLEGIDDYVATLLKLRVPPPFAILMSLQGVRGASVMGSSVGFQPYAMIRQEDLLFPEIFLSEPGEISDYRLPARPLFDALWNAGGHQRSFSYDQQGHWNR